MLYAVLGKLGIVIDVLHQLLQAVFLHELVPFIQVSLASGLGVAQGIVEAVTRPVAPRCPAEEILLGTGIEIRALVLIAERPVKVPCRAELPLLALGRILVEQVAALGMVCLHIAHKVVDQPELCPRLHVHMLGDVATLLQCGSHLVYGSHYVVVCNNTLIIFLREVGVLDVDRQIVGLVLELECLVEIVVQLQQATRCLVYGHAIVGNANLLREAIGTAVVSVDIYIHRNHVAQSLGIHHGGHLLRNGVGGHGTVLLVGNEHPLAVLRQIEGRLLVLLGQLDAEGVLAHVIL